MGGQQYELKYNLSDPYSIPPISGHNVVLQSAGFVPRWYGPRVEARWRRERARAV